MKRLNNKGFTIAEVLVSFSMITIILASIISATIHYRDQLKREEVISQLLEFKNNITKIIYDDIVLGDVVSVDRCIGTANCVNFFESNGKVHTLKIVDIETSTSTNKRGAYLYYDDIRYMLPDSDLGTGEDRVCDFISGFEVAEYPEHSGRLFKVKATFKHKDLDMQQELLFIVS